MTTAGELKTVSGLGVSVRVNKKCTAITSEQTRRTCTSSFVLLFSAKAFAFRHRYDYNNPSWALDAFSLSTRSSKFVTSQAGLLTRHLLFDWTTRADGLTNTARQC